METIMLIRFSVYQAAKRAKITKYKLCCEASREDNSLPVYPGTIGDTNFWSP